MKKIIISWLLFVLASSVFAQVKLKGKLIDNKNEPIEFANVVLQSANHFYGAITDHQGLFELEGVPGAFTLKISMIGYETYEKEHTIQTDLDLGEIVLPELSVQINDVTVKADRIVRKADRFIVNLANDPTVFGKTVSEVLNLSPGVFVKEQDGTISINGKSGTQVYINERPLHESGTDLVRYLQGLKAEDIVRIEVLPTAGAGYDAGIQGGIIKITLRRQRNDGIDGQIGFWGGFAPYQNESSSLGPSFSMNYKYNCLSLYTKLNYDVQHFIEEVEEDVWTPSRHTYNSFDFPIRFYSGRIRLGGIYELKDNQSIGIEGYYSDAYRKNKSFSFLTETIGEDKTDITSLYSGRNDHDNFSASANYILRLDSVGSTFKILLDYFKNQSDDNQNYHSEFRGFLDFDTTYRSDMYTKNNLYAASTDFSYHLNSHSSLAAGLKYIRNEMDNTVLYEYERDGNWLENNFLSSLNRFTEDIGAVYGSFSSRLSKINYTLGLRGEYTYVAPWTNKTDETENQRYFELFPTANIMLPFGKKDKHSIVINYNRKVTRPSFTQLNPFRIPASEYLYLEGNPKLKPAFSTDYSLSLRLFSRFNLMAGVTNDKDAFGRNLSIDTDNPGVIIQRVDNISKSRTYYLSFNTSLNPVKWWQLNINLWGGRKEIEIHNDSRSINTVNGYISNTFYLPKDFMFDLNGWYSSPTLEGTLKTTSYPLVNMSFGKQFFEKKLSARLYLSNILDTGKAKVESNENDFKRVLTSRFHYQTIGLSLTYNFKAGKSVQFKNVETGAVEEKERMK